MFQYQESVSKGAPKLCTPEIWDQLIDSPEVKNICDRIAALNPSDEHYNDRKQALKKRLPIIIPHAASFRNGRRVSADGIPSGLAMLDVDHVEKPREWWNSRIASGTTNDVLKANGIYLVAITASGHGLRVIGERLKGESIEAAQMRMAAVLEIKEYDAVTKDLARASYVVPRDYILYEDREGLFSDLTFGAPDKEETPAFNAGTIDKVQLALPPHKEEPSGASGHSDKSHQPSAGLEAELTLHQGDVLNYRGIPYRDIVEQLMIATGNCGGAEVGERNTVYFSLANYMRYICDFDAGLLLRVLPDFGLSEQERRQVIASAIGRPRKSQIPMVLEGAIAVCERESEYAKSPEEVERKAQNRSTALPLPQLPRLLSVLCGRLPEDYRPAMVIASLPVLGTLATGIRFEYLDRQEQSLSFFSCITAPAASGKSFIRKPIDLLLTPINEQDAIEREKEQAYKERLRATKNSKNQPEDPHACPRNNGISISIAKLLQLLTYAEGKHLIGIGEEMDTLVKSERAGVWSQKSDIYRLAFDNAEYGQAYMSDASFNAHIKVYYNLLLTGTPNSLRRFFKDLENGLATRVCFAQLPDTSFTEIPVFAPYSEEEKEEVIRWARRLYVEKGTVVCPEVGTVIGNWLEKKRQQAIDADSRAMDVLRRRSAVIGFRAGMLCYLLENHQYTDTVGQFAEWVAEYVFRNQMELWGEQMEQELTGAYESQTERGAASSLLALLPKEFTNADLIKLRARKGQSVKSPAICMLLNRWKNNYRIVKINETTWRKTNY
jgi:hypothetical protein